MKTISLIFIFLFIFLIFTGCSATKQFMGEYYLQQNNYDDGYKHFKKEVSADENYAVTHYYYGRFLLAKDEPKKALKHFKKAIVLEAKNSDYYSWLGVTYASLKQYNNEKSAYLKALTLDKKNLLALTYLAHNYFDKKEYIKALQYYRASLKLIPESQDVLYNRALSLNKLGRTPEEKIAWKEYLSYYPAGALARNAVKQLNEKGNFEYKNHLIGFKTITLRNITFKPLSAELNSDSKPSLDVLGEILSDNKKISIHIVVYQLKNKILAKQKAKSIKRYLLTKYPKININRLKLSWFNQAKRVVISKRRYQLDETVDFITAAK